MADREGLLPPPIRPVEPFLPQSPERKVMPNGIPLLLFRTEGVEAVRLDILVRGGQLHQEQPLVALFTARMLREGTARFTAAEVADRLDRYGAWTEASTSMNYSFLTLYSLNKWFAPTLEVVRSMIREPLFPEKELAVAVAAGRQQCCVSGAKVEVMARRELRRSLFGASHPCGRYAVPEDYDRLEREALYRFHRRHYHSGGCTLCLSGGVTPAMLEELEQAFGLTAWGELSEAADEKETLPPVSPRPEKRIRIERAGALQSAVGMGMLTIGCHHPDFPGLQAVTTLLGGYFGSRLTANLREEKGYTYGISASLVPCPDCGLLAVMTQTANEYAEQVVREVHREIERLRDQPVSAEELARVKSYMAGETCRGCEGPFAAADAYIFLLTSGLDEGYLSRSQQTVKEMTAGEVLRLARTYLRGEEMKEIIAGEVPEPVKNQKKP